MEKKLYYIVESDRDSVTVDSLEAAMEIIKSDHGAIISDYTTDEGDMFPYWTIHPTLMTEEEYLKYPEA